MDKIICFIVFSFSINFIGWSQTVNIKGHAFNSTTNYKNNNISVSINDTLHKLLNHEDEIKLRQFIDIKTNWKKYWSGTNSKGKFRIKADINDSITFRSSKHYKKSFLVSDLMKLDSIKIILKSLPCEDAPCDYKSTLIVVKGKKISYEEGNYNYCNHISMDSEWAASYKIDSLIYGDYDKQNIDFKVSVHASYPTFQNYTDVILYINNSCNKYTLTRGGYDIIYKTRNGKWATKYSAFYLNHIPENLRPQPQPIDFLQPVVIEFHESWDDNYISERWYEPYYTINGRSAIANYGFYLGDAVKIRLAYLNEFYNIVPD